MKTPYDAAQRIKRRELDDLRQALLDAEAQLTAVAALMQQTGAALDHERIVASSDPRFDIGPYAAAKQAEIERLRRATLGMEADIEGLRARLLTKFEALKPLDLASDEYRVAKRREAARREREKLDEVAARRR